MGVERKEKQKNRNACNLDLAYLRIYKVMVGV